MNIKLLIVSLISFMPFARALDIRQQDKMRGCILGAALGDALGAPVEFIKSLQEIKKQYPPDGIQGIQSLKPKSFWLDTYGNKVLPYTDDTAMSIVVVRTLAPNALCSVNDICAKIAQAFAKDMDDPFGWACPKRAPGISCQKNMIKIKERLAKKEDKKDPANWWKAGGPQDGGCGSVMHAHPIGLFFAHDPQQAELLAVEHSKITHGAPIALAACAAMAVGVAHAYNDVDPAQVVEHMYHAAAHYDALTAQKIAKAITYAKNNSVSSDTVFTEFLGWAAHDAIAAAVYIFMKYPHDLKKAIVLGVNTPGDSDSIASMAGALVGARMGYSQLPIEWLEFLEGKEELIVLADTLLSTSTNKD